VISADPSGEYEFDDDPDRIDRDAVWTFMAEHAYWGRWRGRDVVEAQITGSWRVIGAFWRHDSRMVGFARAVSDGLSIAYLADVYIEPEHRGRRLGVELVKAMVDDGPGAHFRWMLHTHDAHGLYAKFGFAEPNSTYLERPGGPPR
jgi:GNAT superfamily N-acetyltransferase